MKQSLIPILFFILALSFHSCKGDSNNPDPPQAQNEVSGTVKDVNGKPYPNAKMKLFNVSQTINESTDASGTFGFDVSTNGAYELTMVPPLASSVIGEDSIVVEVQTDVEKKVNFVLNILALPALTVVDAIDIFGEIRNAAGMVPTDPGEEIYARNAFDAPIGMLTAIKAPDGHQLTLSEWKNALGNIEVHCNGNSSTVDISLQGMIPNGTYTFWLNFLNKKKGPGESVNFGSDVVKIEPLGSGTLNVKQADGNGIITTSINHAACVLTEAVALVLVVDYHINGNTFGADHIPDEEDVNHMLVYFQ